MHLASPPPLVVYRGMAPQTRQSDLSALAASMEAMRRLLEESRDEAREDRRDNNRALSSLGERLASSETELRAVKNAQESTAASVLQGYRQHERSIEDGRSATQAVQDRLDTFRHEVEARFKLVEQGVSAVVPSVADATNSAAEPWRSKVTKIAKQNWWMAAGIGLFALVKWWIPDVHALGVDWKVFVHAVNGTDKIISLPPPG